MRPILLLCSFLLLAASCTGADEAIDEAATTTVVLGSASTTDGAGTNSDPGSGADSGSVSTGELENFTVEPVSWEECGRQFCSTVVVPIDHSDPAAGTLGIAINMAPARDERIGVLLVNPGGPGASGVQTVAQAGFFFTDAILDSFDIIGFDPRGVGDSEPNFACGAAGTVGEAFSSVDPPVDTSDEVAIVEGVVQSCVDTMGAAASRLGTEFVVRDMDLIRQALGEEQISYMGFSYGSAIGLWYASIFPDRVRAMVVDGADNPLDDLSTQEIRIQNGIDEFQDFERLLRDALESCDSSECPIFNDGDPIGYYLDTADKFDLVVADVSDNPDAAILGLITPLYNEALWPSIHQGLFELRENDDATVFATLARQQFLAAEDGMNFTGFVNCLDGWSLFPELDREVQLDDERVAEARYAEEFPLIWPAVRPSVDPCPFTDTIVTPPFAGTLDGAGVPIVVVGNRSDPATPFSESEEVATETMSNGYLIEVDHPSHVVYPANGCVNDYVHDALIDLQLPEDRRVECERQEASEVDPDRSDDDRRAELHDICVLVGPDLVPELDDDRLDAACDDFVAAVEEGGGLDLIDRVGDGDQDATSVVGTILGTVLFEAAEG